ncbi:MAG TPA: CRISPR-associated helicase Cas3', partial [Chakrabartia sp.]|nr:CRISPR-associated helicase Cas3' [Chakrabartia sp.]
MSGARDHANFIGRYWGKAQPQATSSSAGCRFHPLVFHMLDVAAAADALLATRHGLLRRMATMLSLGEDQARLLLVWLAAIHDFGKFARAFQCKVPEFWADPVPLGDFNSRTRHDADGRGLWKKWIEETALVDRIWADAGGALDRLTSASLCHHGEPAAASGIHLAKDFGPGAEDALACRDALLDLLLPAAVNARPLNEERAKDASHWVAGLVTVADWLGSSQRWFPYATPDVSLDSYWGRAREQAGRAVRESGLAGARPRSNASFETLTGKTSAPTPLQQWALDTPLPDGPVLAILEDVTGAGKTEAAHILVHRLIREGRASGAWWAMPTMATANAMYARQSDMLAGLFDPAGPKPSLALSHGQSGLHDAFQASIADWGTVEAPLGDGMAGVTASAACAAFLADDRRLSLLADIGAGTIDQAVLSVLPSRFNTVRLLGLAEKVLVVDEVHAHDAYVTEELMRLLEFHRAQGGSAILLSATLTNKQRHDLIAKWQGLRKFKKLAGWNPDESRYPLASISNDTAMQANEIAPASWSRRTTSVERVETPEAVLARLKVTLDAGGCAAWVRNTVDDVLAAAEMARAAGVEPIVFHARFAQCNRQCIEAKVMEVFGPESTADMRRGQLVIATQVIEQSLNLDFDQLASDLAPIDLLLQRAGRMRRHARSDRPAGAGGTMLVLAPAPVEDAGADWLRPYLGPTGAVYRNHGVLWRTVRELDRRGGLSVPDDVRAMVEAVHHPDGDCPAALVNAEQDAIGKERGSAAISSNQLLKLEEGYTLDQPYQSELKISTRNADAQLTIRLAKRDERGAIIPWAPVNDLAWKAWALSEVRARPRIAPPDSKSLPALDAELAPIIATWGKFEQEIPVCVLEPDGAGGWRGELASETKGVVGLWYHQELGLSRDQ